MSAGLLSSDAKPRQVPDQAELVEHTLSSGFPLLRFPKALEARFMADGEVKRFVLMVIAGLASVLAFGSVNAGDYLMSRSQLPMAMVVRWVLYGPVIVAGLMVLRRLRMPALNEWMIAATGLYATILEAIIVLQGGATWSVARVVQLNIIVVYTCAIARFWPALSLGVAASLIHLYVVTHMMDATGVLVPCTTLLFITCTGFVLYGSYKQEHDERMAYLLDAREQALNAELTEAHERLTHMATTDALTGLANRRYFEDFLSECWQRAQAQRRVLSVMVLDVDFFKLYNDRYGHQAGDRCLVGVAEALAGSIRRPGDLVARWGGEEFVIVMMDADADAAAAAAERIRDAVAALDMVHEASRCADRVTVSGGRASIRPDAQSNWQELVQMADDALYRAKDAGRNRICAGYDVRKIMHKIEAVS